jgi:hypothetical protein
MRCGCGGFHSAMTCCRDLLATRLPTHRTQSTQKLCHLLENDEKCTNTGLVAGAECTISARSSSVESSAATAAGAATAGLGAGEVVLSGNAGTSQIRTVRSKLPVARRDPSAFQLTDSTPLRCPLMPPKMARQLPSRASQIRILRSLLPEATTCRSVGWAASSLMERECPTRFRYSRPDVQSINRMIPLFPAIPSSSFPSTVRKAQQNSDSFI